MFAKIISFLAIPIIAVSSFFTAPNRVAKLEQQNRILESQIENLTALIGKNQNNQDKEPERATLGIFNPTGGGTYRLQSSIGSTDSSITLSSFKEPVSNLLYTMSYLNSSIEYGTLEPGNATKKEFISFTGITQNSDGTASLTGVTRGLGFSFPYTASTTLQQTHSGQSIFILSNPPQLTNQYANKNNTETIANTWTFTPTSSPLYWGNPTWSSVASTTLTSKGYVDDQVISGCSGANDSTSGCVEIGTATEVASSSHTGSTGSILAIPAQIASSSPYVGATTTVVVTRADHTIDPLFFATSSGFNYTWGASTTFSSSGTTTFQGQNQFTNPASSTFGWIASDRNQTGDNYWIIVEPDFGALKYGMQFKFWPNATNTLASTLSVNDLASTSILRMVRGEATTTQTNDIRPGVLAHVFYDGTNFQLMNPLTGDMDVSSFDGIGAVVHGGSTSTPASAPSPTTAQDLQLGSITGTTTVMAFLRVEHWSNGVKNICEFYPKGSNIGSGIRDETAGANVSAGDSQGQTWSYVYALTDNLGRLQWDCFNAQNTIIRVMSWITAK